MVYSMFIYGLKVLSLRQFFDSIKTIDISSPINVKVPIPNKEPDIIVDGGIYPLHNKIISNYSTIELQPKQTVLYDKLKLEFEKVTDKLVNNMVNCLHPIICKQSNIMYTKNFDREAALNAINELHKMNTNIDDSCFIPISYGTQKLVILTNVNNFIKAQSDIQFKSDNIASVLFYIKCLYYDNWLIIQYNGDLALLNDF